MKLELAGLFGSLSNNLYYGNIYTLLAQLRFDIDTVDSISKNGKAIY